MNPFSLSQVFNMKYEMKAHIAEIGLLALGVVLENLSWTCPEMKEETAEWEEGRTFAIGILPDGPAVTLKKENGKIRYLGKGLKDPKLTIYFKNMDSALLLLMGQIGAHTASVQRRAIIHGSLAEAVQTVRAMSIVTTYLFPDFIIKKTFKRAPRLNFRQRILKGRTYLALVFSLIVNSNK